jgi:hypothetical protein
MRGEEEEEEKEEKEEGDAVLLCSACRNMFLNFSAARGPRLFEGFAAEKQQ